MILFLKDYDKYPSAIIDTETKNRSFVRTCSLYSEMGIKNHLFPLVLMDPTLQGVDPFDPNLTLDTQLRIALECKVNPFYFFREIVRVPAQAGGDASPLDANRGNIAVFWCFFNHITTMLIQPRQTGKSLSVDCLNEYLMNIRCLNTEINLLTKDETLRAANMRRIKDIDAELPSYLRRRTKNDLNNNEEITYKALGNRYRGHLPQKSPKMAYNVGRGLSSPIFQIDEGPFQSNIAISLPAALSAGTALREKAALNNEPYGTILTTTAGKKDDRDGKFMFNFMSEAASWTEKFFDCENIEELESIVRKNSRTGKLRINATFSHKQLGKTDKWLKTAIEDTGSTGEDADRDYFNIWTSGTMYSPLPISVLETMRASQRSETHTTISEIGGYLTKWYVDENVKESILSQDQLVMSLDTSDASGGDDISMLLNRVSDYETIAAGTYNETNLITFAEWLVDWLVKHPNITMIIERKSSGVAILDYLLLMLPAKGIDPFRRLFNRIVNDSIPGSDIFREISIPVGRRPNDIYTRYKKTFGFATSGTGITSRSDLYSNTLQNAGKLVGDRVRDVTTINQITGLVNINGRIDHQQGEHDDMCFIGSTLVRTIDGNRPIKDLKVGDLVLTRKGYKPIVTLFCSEKEVITQYGITGTPNHPFITPSGEIQFKDLKSESVVYVWNEKLSIITERTITDILNQKEHNTGITSGDTISGKNHQLHYIDKSTQITTDKYHLNTSYTTKMAISLITQLKTLNVLLKQSILKNIHQHQKKERDEEKHTKLKTILIHGKKKILSLLENTPLKTAEKVRVSITGEEIIQNSQSKCIQKLVEEVPKQEKRKEIVYNLMVADCHEYFVNDILVHNCIAWLLGFWLLTKGTNLSFYGIESGQILSEINANKIVSKKEYVDYIEQQEVRRDIEELYDRLQNESDFYVITLLETELRTLNRKLVLEEGEKFSVDELIESLREEKKRSRHVTRSNDYNYYDDTELLAIPHRDPRRGF